MKKLFCTLSILLILSPSANARKAIPELNYANAWKSYVENTQYTLPKQHFPYQNCFEKSAKQYELPVSLLLAMARGESDFNTAAHSSANAYGLMQIIWPGTAKDLGIQSLADLKKPCVNINAGARYIKKQIDRFGGSIHLALAAYNYGPGTISRQINNIPEGANWYSGYIYQHLQYILGTNHQSSQFTVPHNYIDERKLRITTFNEPYRAKAFIVAIHKHAPLVRLDTFDFGMGRYHIILLYGSNEELLASKQALKKVGFPI